MGVKINSALDGRFMRFSNEADCVPAGELGVNSAPSANVFIYLNYIARLVVISSESLLTNVNVDFTCASMN